MTFDTDFGTASNLPVHITVPGFRLRAQVGSDVIGLWFDAEQESLGRKVQREMPARVERFRGKLGKRSDYKKAMITLAEGENIDVTTGV